MFMTRRVARLAARVDAFLKRGDVRAIMSRSYALPADLDRAQQALSRTSRLVGKDHPSDPPAWFSSVYQRALRFDERRDRDSAAGLVAIMSAGLAELSSQEPVRWQIAELASGFIVDLIRALEPAGHYADPDDVARLLALARLGVAVLAPDDPRLGAALFMIGSSLAVSIATDAGPAPFAEVIEVLRGATDASGGPMKAMSAGQLGNTLLLRFERYGDFGDVQAAVVAFRTALDAIPPDHDQAHWCRINLAVGLMELRDAAALDEATDLLYPIRDVPDPATRGRALTHLGRALGRRWAATGNAADLHAAVRSQRAAVAAEPPDSHGLADATNNLAVSLLRRYRTMGSIQDLHEAIELLRGTLARDDLFPIRRLGVLANLAGTLIDRFDATGDPADATEGLRVAREAMATDLPPLVAAQQGEVLGGMLLSAYEISGSTADLYEAIDLIRQAVGAHIGGRPGPALLGRLGVALVIRYELTGAIADLDEAIALYRRARADASWHEPQILMNLCNALELLYSTNGDQSALHEAVRVGTEALERSGQVPCRMSYVTNLAQAYGALYEATGDLAHLDAAIDVQRQALATGPRDDWRRPRYLSNLGAHLLTRAEHAARPADLEEAISTLGQGAGATHTDDPRHATHLLNYGLALHSRYQRDRAATDLDTGLRLLSEAARSPASPVYPRLVAAMSWGRLAHEGHDAAGTAAGYAEAVTLLPLLAWQGLDRADQLRRLLGHSGIATDAAAAMLDVRDPARAVGVLHLGQSVLWSQLLNLETDLSALRRAHPAHAERLDAARAGLKQLRRSDAAIVHHRR